MKKRLWATALAATLCASAFGLAACGSTKNENELWITYFKGGYGSEWVEQLARKFEAENEGVTVRTDADTQLINAVPNMMENGTDYDLIFCHDIAWEDFVAPGQIYCLDDLYKTVVDDKGTTFEQRIWDEDVLASCRYYDRNGDTHYYKVPWTIGTAGIAYNLTVMDRVDDWLQKQGGGDTTRQWNRTPPKDYYELLQYCEDIVAANLNVDPTEPTSGKITPFTWSGASEEWQWDYVVFDWWGQLAGPETMNMFKNFGNVKDAANGDFSLDITKQKNPMKEVYDPEKAAVVRNTNGTVNKEESTYIGWKEFEQAYTLWYDLVVGHKEWSNSKISGYSKFENEQAFASGSAAMTPAACWIEYESKEFLEASGQEVSIMPTPTISHVVLNADGQVQPKGTPTPAGGQVLDAIHAGADDDPSKTIKLGNDIYNRVSFTSSFGDSALIPAASSGRDLAVKFLLFMQEEENAKLFTKLSGGTVLPYKYEYWNSFVENGVDKASAWQKAIFEIDRNSTKFNNYTQHPMMRSATGLRGSTKMTTIWPKNEYYYFKAWNENTGNTYKPATLIATIYQDDIVSSWNAYMQRL